MTLSCKTAMSLEHFHDFYFLHALQAGLSREIAGNPELQFRRSVEKFSEDLIEAMDDIIPNIALRTFVYLYAACLGEARHARESVAKDLFLPCTKSLHRMGVYQMIAEYRPTQHNIDILVKVFSQGWRSGFGGKAWQNIAGALKMYFSMTPSAFIDHVIDLEHNGGTAFNKTDAYDTLYFTATYPGRFNHFLDYKFQKDILTEPPRFTQESLRVTTKVYSLAKRFTTLFNKETVNWILPTLDALDDYLVEWGDGILVLEEKWMEWADVSTKNKPNIKQLVNSLLEDVNPHGFTLEELKKRIKHTKKQAYKKVEKLLTPSLKKSIHHELKQWLAWAAKYAKISKKSVTYQVLPVKIRVTGLVETVCVAVPYDGYGEPTPYGFKFACSDFGLWSRLTMNEKGFTDDGFQYTDGHITLQNDHLVLWANNKKWYAHNNQLEAFLE